MMQCIAQYQLTTRKVGFPEMGNYSKLVQNVRVQISKTHAVCKYDMLDTIHVVNKTGNATFLVHLQKTRKCEMLSGFPCAGNATRIDTFTEDQEM